MRTKRRVLRLTYRFPAFAAVLFWHALMFVLIPINRRTLKGRARWLSRASRGVLRTIGVTLTVSGTPPTSTVIAANHLSYLDILVLSAFTPTVFVAKKEVRRWPLFGWFARMAGTLFIDRSRRTDVVRVGNLIPTVIAEGVSIVIFLEGTSTNGREVLPFRSSLLGPIARLGIPLTPAALAYSVPPGHRVESEICWWGEMTLMPHLLNLFTLSWVHARVGFGSPVPPVSERKLLAAVTRDQVTILHRAVNEAQSPTPPQIAGI